VIAILLTALALLILLGAPLFVIVGVATATCFYGFAGLEHFGDQVVLIQHMENLATKQEFLAIPLFLAAGAVMTAGGIARRLVDVARALVGHLPGGLAIASVLACMFFASISGSSPVTLIAVGTMMFPPMVASGYPENFSLGLVTTAGSLGCLLPPSIAMLIYAISLSGADAVDPSDLFLAGWLPAIFVALLLAIYSVYVGRRIPGARPRFSRVTLSAKLKDAVWALALPLIVLLGIRGGWYTPSQAGAVALVYSLFVTMFIYRELTLRKLLDVLGDSAGLMGTLILIIVLAFGLNDFLALIDIQEKISGLIAGWNLGPAGFLLLVNVVLIVLGALMDSISATLIFAPILAPIAHEMYGIDPIHFGIVFVVNMEIGYLAPPVATNLFVAAAVFKKPFGQVTRAVLPTLAITCAALLVIMYVPTISKALLNASHGRAMYEPFPWTRPTAAPEGGVPGSGGPAGGGPAGSGPAATAGAGAGGGTAAASGLKDLTKRLTLDLDEDDETKPATAAAPATAASGAPGTGTSAGAPTGAGTGAATGTAAGTRTGTGTAATVGPGTTTRTGTAGASGTRTGTEARGTAAPPPP
jgi:C4-dicarboxylate transporter DctM subunit